VLDSIPAELGTPFARLISPRVAHCTEDLPAPIASPGHINAMFAREIAAPRFSELHSRPPRGWPSTLPGVWHSFAQSEGTSLDFPDSLDRLVRAPACRELPYHALSTILGSPAGAEVRFTVEPFAHAFVVDGGQVEPDGRFRYAELVGDLFVSPSCDDTLRDPGPRKLARVPRARPPVSAVRAAGHVGLF
jgi:hypothetical protein